MSAKRRSLVGPSGCWPAADCAGALAGAAVRQSSTAKLIHSKTFTRTGSRTDTRKGMGFIAMSPEDGFRIGIPGPLHGRLTPANRFAETKYSLKHENISLPKKSVLPVGQTPEMQSLLLQP